MSRLNRYSLTLFVLFSVFVTSLVQPPALARDRKPVVISFGQPNIWSLEQAHYLLARMHMTNLSLQAATLTSDKLDPNIRHGTRIQILQQLLEIGAKFDQGKAFQNKRIVEDARFNDARRRELIVRRNNLQNESLALTREIKRLEIERARMDTDESATDDQKKLKTVEIDKKSEELAEIKELITQDTAEITTLAPKDAPTPEFPDALPSPSQLPSAMLASLVEKNAEDLLKAAGDPKLNATTMLDNTIQLQYEIIAKQLTLLRDEVGPGERLVFLELPQSIYTTPGDGDEKMAQTWWHVNGYTRTDPLLRLLIELLEVELKWSRIKQVPAYIRLQPQIDDYKCAAPTPEQRESVKTDPILSIFVGLKCERGSARKAALDKLYREASTLFARIEQNGAKDTSEQIDVIRKLLAVGKALAPDESTKTTKDGLKVQEVEARQPGGEKLVKSTSHNTEIKRRKEIDALKNILLKVLSQEDPLSPSDELLKNQDFKQAWEAFEKFRKEIEAEMGSGVERALEFRRLDEDLAGASDAPDSNLPRRTVRTVDIIPRQSSLNVNDINDTVKATRIVAAFKFLFGFAGEVNFHRQREQFEQFMHQEIYASGFGKGSRDFGWTFGAVPGTKRVAPGVRTTYAALIVPEDAESIVLSARGCYFPRKSYQPLDFQDTGHTDWDVARRYKQFNCGDEQNYVLTIPGGGDISNYWVTSIDYEHGRKNGDYVTVSVRGNNFSSQMGVLIDGVALFPTVGLAQQHLMPRKTVNNQEQALASECAEPDNKGICGRYERVDAEQIVFTFKMPPTYVGTPTITLIAPGKSIDLNNLKNARVNGQANASLRDDAPIMFGMTGLSITNFQVLSNVANQRWGALLTGTGFDAADTIIINGKPVTTATFRSANLVEVTFDLTSDDTLKVSVVRNKQVVSSSYPNPIVMAVNNATVISSEPAVKKPKKPSIMMVKIEGRGLSSRIAVTPNRGTLGPYQSISPNAMIIELHDAKLPVVLKVVDKGTCATTNVILEKEAKDNEAKPKPKPKPKEGPQPTTETKPAENKPAQP